ncbi:MarR family winged helix-turn-helix transcriptional regulator [Pseudomonas jessenii]|uniref:MarR family winged helix-turn-helix transcriptional regulator n=1 Tax=Pseudomonas jessenii TaxID=77298 RepID=UPI0015E8AC19|nr:MarR family transcriptional regulator [Pseudomonas jessenii]
MTSNKNTKQSAAERLLKIRHPGTLEDMIDYRLYLVYRDCGHVTEKICKTEYGINRRRLRMIFCLMYSEGITVSELAQKAELDMAQTSRTIGTMVREGYLKRLSNPENARYAQVILTERGRQLYSDILDRYRSINQSLLEKLTDEELITLDFLLNKLRESSSDLESRIPRNPQPPT